MTGPRWTIRSVLLSGASGDGNATRRRDTNRAFLIGLLIGLVLGICEWCIDTDESTWKMRVAAATGVLVVTGFVAFILLDTAMRWYRKAGRRRRR